MLAMRDKCKGRAERSPFPLVVYVANTGCNDTGIQAIKAKRMLGQAGASCCGD